MTASDADKAAGTETETGSAAGSPPSSSGPSGSSAGARSSRSGGGGTPSGPLAALGARIVGSVPGRMFLCVLAGTLLFLACADFDIWPLAWIGFTPLLWALLDSEGMPRTERPFLYGFLTGLFANGGGFYWIVGLLMRFGHMPFLAAAPLFALLIAYQAITFGLFAWLLCRLRAQVDVRVTFLAPLVWVACELCVPYVFPWYLSITQAWVPTVIQVMDLTGPLGVSFLLVLSGGALFDVSQAVRRRAGRLRLLDKELRAPLLAVFTILAALSYGAVRMHQIDAQRAAAPKLRVGVVQANIGIHEKFVPGLREQQHAVHTKLSAELAARGAELIVWPESSYPYPLPRSLRHDLPDGHPAQIQKGFKAPIILGALTLEQDPDGEYVPYNTAVMLDKSGTVTGTFDKNFLLIFGEYLPFARELGWLRRMIPEISNFARGTTTTTFPIEHEGKTYRLGPMICYEDIIPAFARRLFSDKQPPNLLVNITNDAWFGATSEPYEHMALAVFRAVEHRVDLVRAVNTGVSVFVDAAGRVRQKGPSVDPSLTPGVQPVTLLEDVALLEAGGLYQALGETFGSVCLGIVLFLFVLARRRAGMPVRWPVLLGSAAALHLCVLVAGGLLLRPVRLDALYAALLHRNEGTLPEAVLFQASWQLVVVLVAASLAVGVYVGRRFLTGAAAVDLATFDADPDVRPALKLELLAAIALVTVVPVVLLGRMEGNTGAVVILSGLCTAAAFTGLSIGRRAVRRALVRAAAQKPLRGRPSAR